MGARSRIEAETVRVERAMQLRESWLLFALSSTLFPALNLLFGKFDVVGHQFQPCYAHPHHR